ncbi:unnamed protein product, partial [Iphiclides podalirius]
MTIAEYSIHAYLSPISARRYGSPGENSSPVASAPRRMIDSLIIWRSLHKRGQRAEISLAPLADRVPVESDDAERSITGPTKLDVAYLDTRLSKKEKPKECPSQAPPCARHAPKILGGKV